MKQKLTLLTALFLAVAVFTTSAFAGKPVAPPPVLTITCLNGATAIVDASNVTIGCSGGGSSNVQFEGSGYSGTVTFDVVSPDGLTNNDGGSYRTRGGVLGPIVESMQVVGTWTVTVTGAKNKVLSTTAVEIQ